jgi:SIR2-like domain
MTIATRLGDRDWEILLRRIQDGKCTPFLGAGVNYGVLPLGSEIAQKWADDFQYPLEDRYDLARVAQFLAVIHRDPMLPKEEILKWFEHVGAPDFMRADEPHSVLAELPLPIYMTTNYDDFMLKALMSRGKDARRELCRWNALLKKRPSVFDAGTGFHPTPANPVVFHLHGHNEVPESLVLTEDDYLDFLVNISRQQDLLPPRIQEALTGASLLFIGYRLADWDFRVLFRGLVTSTEGSLRRISVAVQLPPEAQEHEGLAAQSYLTDYFEEIKVRVYWGTAQEFVSELRERWRGFRHDRRA